MKLDKAKAYIFMLRGPRGESVAIRMWTGRAWKTVRVKAAAGSGEWGVKLYPEPLWRRGPRMVLEVPA